MHTSAVLTTAYLNTDYLIIVLSAHLGLKSDIYAHRFILCTQYFTNRYIVLNFEFHTMIQKIVQMLVLNKVWIS